MDRARSLRSRCVHLALTLLAASLAATVSAQTPAVDLSTEQLRRDSVLRLARDGAVRRAEALDTAKREGWIPEGDVEGRRFQLMRMEKDRPFFYESFNRDAAMSTNADLVVDAPVDPVDGEGVIVGVWDGGGVMTTHREFGDRATIEDNAPVALHATHVGGTIAAAGVDADARGMAPHCRVESYEWYQDSAEMAERAANASGQSDRIQVSNHSYGSVAGWTYSYYSGSYGKHWLGSAGEREDRIFGLYDYGAAAWDGVCHAAPYYLPFKAAGNDRNDSAPDDGETFYYYDGGWQEKAYDPGADPLPDGYDDGGFDSIPAIGCAKNVMTVGAIHPAVADGVRSLEAAEMTTFSGWGPTDDGRVKPDVVADGYGVYSTSNRDNEAYSSMSGTSMASPNAAGVGALLVSAYRDRFDGEDMRASTLKGLMIHTADDLGAPGPDYSYGWGLINARAAVDLIDDAAAFAASPYLVETDLSASRPSVTRTVVWNGIDPLRATVCWTDPAADYANGLDDRSPRLVNDLDLRIVGPGGQTHPPFVLDPENPAQPASRGDNVVDNVEQVVVETPAPAGLYTIEVSYKGSLDGGSQVFSLIVSGFSPDDLAVVADRDFVTSGPEGGPYSIDSVDYTVTNFGDASIDWTAAAPADWVGVTPREGVLAPGESAVVTVRLKDEAAALSAGVHTAEVAFVNTDSDVEQVHNVVLTSYVPAPRVDALVLADLDETNDPAEGWTNEPTITVRIDTDVEFVTQIQIDEYPTFYQATVYEAGADSETDYLYEFHSDEDGEKTVYVRLLGPGGPSETVSATIALDTMPPVTTAMAPDGAAPEADGDLQVSFLADDPSLSVGSGVAEVVVSIKREDGSWRVVEAHHDPAFPLTVPGAYLAEPGEYRIRSAGVDRAGNTEAPDGSGDLVVTIDDPDSPGDPETPDDPTGAAPAAFWMFF